MMEGSLAKRLLFLTDREIQDSVDENDTELISFDAITRAAEAVLSNAPVCVKLPPTLFETLGEPRLISFGCPVLDQAFGGGLLGRGVTELTGEAGTGKSQLCMQLALQTPLPVSAGGLDATTVYLGTTRLHSVRLQRIAEATASGRRRQGHAGDLPAKYTAEYLCNKVLVQTVASADQLESVLQTRIPHLCQSTDVRLVVVDSIAALFRYEYSVDEAAQRAAALFRLGYLLRTLSTRFSVAVLVTNQVSAVFDDPTAVVAAPAAAPNPFRSVAAAVKPSLGLAWAGCLTQRVLLSKPSTLAAFPVPVGDGDSVSSATHRTLRVVFSPYLRQQDSSLHIVIDANGVSGSAP